MPVRPPLCSPVPGQAAASTATGVPAQPQALPGSSLRGNLPSRTVQPSGSLAPRPRVGTGALQEPRPGLVTAASAAQAQAGGPALPSPGVSPAELPLSGYLFARALLKETVDHEDVPPLRQADSTMRQTRRALPLGRGNVAADLQRTGWLNLSRVHATRTYFERTVLPEIEARMESQPGAITDPVLTAHACLAVTSIVLGAGNCGEHAEVATHLHARKLQPGREQVLMLEDPNNGTHEWAEVRNERGRDHHVIMDPWSIGTAVLAPDSLRPVAIEPNSAGPYRHEDAPAIEQAMAERWKIATTRDKQALAHMANKPVPQARRALIAPALQEPKPVLNPAFFSRVAAQLPPGPGSTEAHTRSQAQTLEGLAAEVGRSMNEPLDPASVARKQALNMEVLAAGVARSMGVPINQASVKTALPPIVDAARRLVIEGQDTQAGPPATPPRAQ